ncbi:bacterial regulatory, arsR family protein [Mycobacterium intracellulare]|nr:bacterial regulatory, arsR family protein [Mycobacterium intracellulare]
MLSTVTGVDRVFLALANPVRRELLEILFRQPLSAGELSERFELSRPAVAEHLKVLRDARLVADEPRGAPSDLSPDRGAPGGAG